MKESLKKILPYLGIIAVFVIIAYAYSPELLSGKKVDQVDISGWQGMANEIVTHNKANPEEKTLWTNSMFGGMPATSISVDYEGDYTKPIYDFLFWGERPASYLIISLIGGFLLFLAFGVNIYLAALGAIAITFCSYNMQIMQVGHNSKMVAIAFAPWVLAAIVYAYRKNWLIGAALFGLALSFQIKANHPQITYYLAMMVLGLVIWKFCSAVKEKQIAKFFKISCALLVAGLLGIATNINHLWPTYEYAEHTTRGGSELSGQTDALTDGQADNGDSGQKKSRSGLDLEYATSWSYGIEESLDMFIPNLYGGSSSGELSRSSESYKTLQKEGYPAEQIIKSMPLYWGPQPFTAGPMYMGAVTIFLCLLGFFVIKGGVKWWVAGVGLVALMLSWGYHLMPVSELFFKYAPLYNKFRTVSMILVLLQILLPIMAVLCIDKILYSGSIDKKHFSLYLKIATGITCGIALLFILIPSLAGSFISETDSQLPAKLLPALISDRISLLRTDALRSMLFVIAAAALLWLGYTKKLKPNQTVIILTLLLLCDLWSADKRYLNSSHFVSQRELAANFTKRPVDEFILNDSTLDYRVLDLSSNNIFSDSYTSYYHKSIGGYSPAKLQRYQDLIEHHISREIGDIANSLNGVSTFEQAEQALKYEPVLSMLNTKYLIINPELPPLENKFALGNAWFVNSISKADNADMENEMLKSIDPASEAVIASEFIQEKYLGSFYETIARSRGLSCFIGNGDSLSNSSITLISYAPNKLIYEYKTDSDKIAVFSEIYYSPGWNAEIRSDNGKTESQEIFRVNYTLRGTVIPKGDGEIIFTFAPESFIKGEKYSEIASIILILSVIAAFAVSARKNIVSKKGGLK